MLRAFLADSFACEYVPSCAALTTIARAIVGVAPLQSVSTPSSRLKKLYYSHSFLRYSIRSHSMKILDLHNSRESISN